ncbi:hypothetical protein [Kitasatospora sp. NPDC096204]|uniref:hypothetical protein n=1 Tax=Kitasatospora sp. NPDC096204 TaxID=3364094 RepID=UPI0038080DDE
MSVDLRVRGLERDPAPASVPLSVDAPVHDGSGDYVGELLVWAEGGTTLSALEYAWVTDEMPTVLPPVDRIRVRAGDRGWGRRGRRHGRERGRVAPGGRPRCHPARVGGRGVPQ